MGKFAFITGICGQDGWYLKNGLLSRGYTVYGTDVPAALAAESKTGDFKDCTLFDLDLTDFDSVMTLFERISFSHVYNLAGVSFVPASWDDPRGNFKVNAGIPLNLLEVIRRVSPETRLFQACSSELFGDCPVTPQDESTPFHPRSPYAVNKIYAYNLCRIYREYQNCFASCGILYNHESERRPHKFVTRKITSAAARISLGLQNEVELGNLDAVRDWGHASDTVEAMIRILEYHQPDDFIVASGHLHSVRDFCRMAFEYVGLDYQDHVRVNSAFFREEHSILHGNPTKARRELGWESKIDFKTLVGSMVERDLELAREQV